MLSLSHTGVGSEAANRKSKPQPKASNTVRIPRRVFSALLKTVGIEPKTPEVREAQLENSARVKEPSYSAHTLFHSTPRHDCNIDAM